MATNIWIKNILFPAKICEFTKFRTYLVNFFNPGTEWAAILKMENGLQ